ncbi:hypothetical protein E05_39360 [Plautia stali symbiont]|nr:hypothetical protein E05_39360 [Plautia stali symbiont]
MPHLLTIEAIHQRRQRGGFAAAGRAGDEDKPFLQLQQRAHHVRQLQARHIWWLAGNQPQRQRQSVTLAEQIGAQPAAVAERDGEIDVTAAS